jgi:UDP-N-acetylmuramoyl-tripeptide--D-alanyl-D-alanine ligase
LAALATGGEATRPWSASGVSIDSRTLAPGDLFVAIRGDRLDGHAFVASALGKGASAAVVAEVPDDLPPHSPLLVVPDTLDALRGLARAARARSGARIIGVTGSVGKTSVKAALRHVLSPQAATVASDGSLNNHWGVPLSLARLPGDAAFGIFEMGMNHAGEITPLSRLVRPHVAVITAIEAVHIEFFPTVEAIADAKAEIFQGLEPDGIAVLNQDNPHFARLRRAAEARDVARILAVGSDPAADVRLIEWTGDDEGSTVQASVDGQVLAYRLGVAGRHWVTNSLIVLATVLAVGADVAAAAQALAGLQPEKGRGRRHTVRLPGGGRFTLVDDSYNASPVSMAGAIEILGHASVGPGGRRIAVLGDMLELGPQASLLHAGLAQPLLNSGIDLVFAAGPFMAHLMSALPAPRKGAHAEDAQALAAIVVDAVRAGDVVTVKGSAGSRMGTVVRALLALDALAATREIAPRRVNGG